MAVEVSGVEGGSIGEKAGFAAWDLLETINQHPIGDVLDYRFYMMEVQLTLTGKTANGDPFSRTLRKGEYQELGLEFDTYLMDQQRYCKNKCVFCFIDQLPQGLRDTLYFKDDDSRMSFLFGNYITLTNLEDADVERILAMHISPVNISVHTTNPQLRVKMMANPRAGQVLDYIPQLTKGDIKVNCQLVLCPGYNDGEELHRSLTDLCALAPNLQSVAVVPVGLTKHRDGLSRLRLFTPQEAQAVLDLIDQFGNNMLQLHDQRIVFAADEFYLAAHQPIPPAAHYEEFAQLENGVGLLALLMDEFSQALALELSRPLTRTVTIATGTAAHPFLAMMAQQAISHFPGLSIQVIPIPNLFFGPAITVAGLVTGGDLLTHLTGLDLGDALLFPAVMLRHEGDLFLDGLSLEDLSATLSIPAVPVVNDGFVLLEALLG